MVLLLVLIAGGIAGFAPVTQVRALGQDEAAVTFAFWGDPAERVAYEEVIEGFEAAQPGIQVETIYTPGQDDYQTKIATSFSAGNPPDVFLINYRRYGQYAARGALEPLGSRLAESETLDEADFYDVPLDAFRYQGGELFCLPQNVSSLVVYYNADLFAAAGVSLPAGDWTWDDFVATATALTVDGDGDGFADQHGLVVDPGFIRYAPFIWGAGGEIVDDVDRPTQLTLDTAEAKAGIQWFMDLGIQRHNVVPTEAEVLAEDNESRFMNGRAAMLMQSRRIVPTLREIDDFTWDVAPLPRGPEAAGVLHSDAFCLAAESDAKDAAWAFIEYAVGVEGQTALAATGRSVPSLRAVAESDVFLGKSALSDSLGGIGFSTTQPANSQVFLNAIPAIRRVPSISTWPEVEEVFDTAFKRAFYEEIDLESAIDVVVEGSRDPLERALQEQE
jgi:multiple sugar transport system substrate-binding protein